MWYWRTAILLLSPVGLVALVIGGHDLIVGSSWSSRALGALSIAVGIAALAPIARGRNNRRLQPLPTLGSAVIVATAGLALLVAEWGSGAHMTWRLVAPAGLLLAGIALPVLFRLQGGTSEELVRTLRGRGGQIVAANAAILSLTQVAVSLRSSTHAAPVRPLIDVSATKHGRVVEVTVKGSNKSGADLPVLADLVDVVAMRCPEATTGLRLVRQDRQERVLASRSFDVSLLLDAARVEGCRDVRVVGTGPMVGESSFVAPGWSTKATSTYPLTRRWNTICAFALMSTIDHNPRRLQLLDYAKRVDGDPLSDLMYRYRVLPTGWIDDLVHRRREVVVAWSARTVTPSGRSYAVPNEYDVYAIDGADQTPREMIAPGPIRTLGYSCSEQTPGERP